VATHYDEQAQIEELKRWWRENRLPLVAGLALGLGAIFAWQAWRAHRDARAAAASHIYEDLDKAAALRKFDEAMRMGERLEQDYADTPYAGAAALKLAQIAAAQDQYDQARKQLAWAAEHPKDPLLRPLARLRLAQILWQLNQPQEALRQLEGDPGTYAELYDELRGDIELATGNRAAARAAYEQALKALGTQDSTTREGLQRKLDELADAGAPGLQ
jgi:predicted negative regulator of RcsB-dependent stress response